MYLGRWQSAVDKENVATIQPTTPTAPPNPMDGFSSETQGFGLRLVSGQTLELANGGRLGSELGSNRGCYVV